jgi:hypothetical protein
MKKPLAREGELPMSSSAVVRKLDCAEELNVQITDDASQELQRLRQITGHSVDGLLAISIGLLILVADAEKFGNKVLLTSRSGRPLKEIIIPATS